MILFGPLATLKVRTTLGGDEAISEMLGVLQILYQGRFSLTEQVASRDWALVGAFGDGVIPWQYRLDPVQASFEDMVSLNGAILEAALRTQNYDKGLEKFVRKFDTEAEMEAVVAIEPGKQGDCGWAVLLKQGPRRCLLLDTTDGLTEEETLWVALSAWSNFHPRSSRPRQEPGELYYPDGASHLLEESWQFFNDLSQMPSFSSKSQICQVAMLSFSQGLNRYPCSDAWIPHPAAEAPGKCAKIATNAAISRVRPISDGPNQWEMYRSSTYIVCQSSLGLSGTELAPGLGLTDTCVAQGNPSQT
jgi:hypothetical protein